MQCPSCGFDNAETSRFCRQCGTPLPGAAPPIAEALPELGASLADAALQEELVTQSPESNPPAEASPAPAEALAPGTEVAGYTIVEARADRPRTYRAQAPADVCMQCGTPAAAADARFCEECGAELLPRDVLLVELDDAMAGPARLVDLPDDPIKALLPPVTLVEHNGKRYLVVEEVVPGWQSLAELLADSGEAPDRPAALEDADAIPLALQLARLIQWLHAHGLALGDLSLAQLLVGPQGRIRLRDVSAIAPLSEGARQADLVQLYHTLEDLTRIPRETRKLDPATLEGASATPRSLQEVLAMARTGGLSDADAWVAALTALEQQQRAVRHLVARVGARSDVGLQRELNEDALLVIDYKLDMAGRPLNAGLYVVADGMGGHESGEIASALAVQSMANVVGTALIELLADSAGGLAEARLHDLALQAVERANRAVFEEGRRRGNDMGTTLTFALVVGDHCVIGNVGDSRTYLLRDGVLQRVTKDHSLVQRLLDMGQITPDEVYTHPHRNAITRSLGERPQVQLDLFPLRLQPGDGLLCCSDGLWEMVRDPRIQEIVLAEPDPQRAAQRLIEAANAGGGEDNITAVLVLFSEQ
ncbi:Stp1/IreP family PP2C-type Ser/Thr phosphatase [Kallotenue papyrolyticum]|uniref:Stp1/IreP family PP2C-type Ser/Thr phosphatase n=1 Tax=Kallotenue papyrolyticum TaxID=1325125 RepID=UPI0004785339|nr:Stp1/IreP family PP2C-type Ser/Thr phosphatase [Kallotenue papyrolyticum]